MFSCGFYKFFSATFVQNTSVGCFQRLKAVNNSFYKIFAWIYLLRQEIRADIAQIDFRVLFKNLILSPWRVGISNLIKKWLNSSN